MSRVYAYDEWMRPSTIISSGIEYCKFIQTDPAYQIPPFYAIKLKEHPAPLMISQADLSNKNRFTQFLAQQLNVDIDTHRYRARLLTALRKFFRDEAVCVNFPFYYGWEMRKSRWEYTIFTSPQNKGGLPIRTTHGSKDFDWHSCLERIEEASHTAPLSLNASVQLTAASQAVTSMNAIQNKSLQKFLWLLIHIVSMYSLLVGTKNEVPFGICFYSENEKPLTPLKTLLSWFQDDPIKLTEGKNRFVTLLTERKDQPVLILDSEGQIPNSKLLEQGIDTNYIECGRKSYALQALPIILSNVSSHITQSKKFICLTLDDADFSPDANRVF